MGYQLSEGDDEKTPRRRLAASAGVIPQLSYGKSARSRFLRNADLISKRVIQASVDDWAVDQEPTFLQLQDASSGVLGRGE